MNRHYDRYLTSKYVPLYQDRNKPMNQTAMCWGFDCGDGWFNIIKALSYDLCLPWLDAKRKYDIIKHREGYLWFNVMWGGNEPESERNYRITYSIIEQHHYEMEESVNKVPIARQVKEKYGGLRFYVDNATEEQYKLIDFVEGLSLSTCEVCGKMGKREGFGWITTRCKEHRSL